MRAARNATAPPSANRPIRPTIGSSLAVFGRRPEVPTGCVASAVDGAGRRRRGRRGVGCAVWSIGAVVAVAAWSSAARSSSAASSSARGLGGAVVVGCADWSAVVVAGCVGLRRRGSVVVVVARGRARSRRSTALCPSVAPG